MSNIFNSVRNNITLINQWLIHENLARQSNLDISIKSNLSMIEPKIKEVGEQEKKQYEKYFHEDLSRYEKKHLGMILDRNFSFLMIDNSIVQCVYRFENFKLTYQKMAFYQSPFKMPYESHYQYYDQGEEDMVDGALKELGEIVSLRFDHEPRHFKEVEHPNTHLHVGAYRNCRIPVNRPISAIIFFKMVIRNFYSISHDSFALFLDKNKGFLKQEKYRESITKLENEYIHINVPG